MNEYEQQADELQELSDKVGANIGEAREDWERKKADDDVPGAQGAPRKSESELPPPEPDETD
ncbi:MAG TPA: hypothetical protein VI300_15090 [Solirubrobacter sp.]